MHAQLSNQEAPGDFLSSCSTMPPSTASVNFERSTEGDVSKPQKRRWPITPAVLRDIFAASRTPGEERSISRLAFFRFAGFLISCLGISLAATRGWGKRNGLLGAPG